MRRYVKHNASTRCVRRYVALDCETRDEPAAGGRTIHRLWHGAALYFEVHNNRAMRQQWHTFSTADELWTWLYGKLSAKHTTWLVAHFAAYDATAARLWREMDKGNLSPRRQKAKKGEEEDPDGPPGLLCVDDPPVILDLVHKDGPRLVVVDLMNWFPLPLTEIARSFGSQIPPPAASCRSDADWIFKCRLDVLAVRDAVVGLVQWIRSNDLGNQRYTASGQGMAAWRHLVPDVPVQWGHEAGYKQLERAAYYPGLMRAYFVGAADTPSQRWWREDIYASHNIPAIWTAPCYRLDVNACYPAVMESNDFPVKLVSSDVAVSLSRAAALLEVFEAVATVTIDSPRTPYPLRCGPKVRWGVGRFVTHLCGPDLRAALAAGHIAAIHEMHWHQRGRPFGKFCRLVYALRERYGSEVNPALRCASKTMGNALHGKMAQWGGGWRLTADAKPLQEWGIWHTTNVDSQECVTYRGIAGNVQVDQGQVEKEDNYPLIAAYTSAYARQLVAHMRAVAGPQAVYYQDVDSLHVSQAGYERLTDAGLVHPTQPGKLKVEVMADCGRWYGPKHYTLGDTKVVPGVSPHAWMDERGVLRQKHFLRLNVMLNDTPPDGPVTWTPPSPTPRPTNDGHISKLGWLEWPNLT